MEKISKTPWRANSNAMSSDSDKKGFFISDADGYIVAEVPSYKGTKPAQAKLPEEFGVDETIDANAMLIAASPKLLEVTILSYVSILQTTDEKWRIKNQTLYCQLRDYISLATNNSSELVQLFYEHVAILMKHEKLSFEDAVKKATHETQN